MVLVARLSGHIELPIFNFNIRPRIAIGFALHWVWVWVGFWSSNFYSISPTLNLGTAGIFTLEPLWVLSLSTNILGYGILFFLAKKYAAFGLKPSVPLVAGTIIVTGTLLISYPIASTFNEPVSIVYTVGALLTGCGSAILLILWGELLTTLGARQTVVYSVLATLIGSAIYLITIFIPEQPVRILTVFLPVLEVWFFTREQGILRKTRNLDLESKPKKKGSKKDKKKEDLVSKNATGKRLFSDPVKKSLFEISAISLFFGLSYGIMKGLFVFSNEHLLGIRDFLNILALVLGALAILATTSVFRMDLRHMTYQIALPFMAAGFVLFALGSPFDLVGFAAHQLGYQYFYIIIWALWAILARRLNTPVSRIACLSMVAIMGGQLAGSLIGAHFITVATSAYEIAIFAACSVFIILLVALFAFESPFPGSNWGLFEQDESASKFKRTLRSLAGMRGLSPRETEVFKLLARGRNCSFISSELVISEATTKTHIKRIYKKFGVRSQQALLDMIELEGKVH